MYLGLSTTLRNPPDKGSKTAFQKKLLKSLFWKFKWKFFLLFFLTFLINYITFLIHFNLANNLSHDRGRGHFFYLFGKYQLTKKIDSSKAYVNWSKLLLILFLLYFPLKIIIRLVLGYWQKNCEREVNVYLIKKMLNYADKNKELVVKKPDNKAYVVNNVVPEFSRQFVSIPVDLFEIFVSFSFASFSLYFLVNSYQLSQLVPLLVIFVLVNLVWFGFLYNHFGSFYQTNLAKKKNFQNIEKFQLKTWLEGLKHDNKPKSLSKLLDRNSQQITNLDFLLTLCKLPELIISGISLLFIFLYYQVYCGGRGNLSWDIYFIANSLQTIFFKTKKGFSLLPIISNCQENYQKIGSFFS